MHRNLPGQRKKAGAREPDAGFFCTSVFLTPQPFAAYNKTEIRKSNQNTHPKAKNPWLKEGAARPPGEGWQQGSKGETPALAGEKHNTKKKRTNKKGHARLPLRSRDSQKSPDYPDLSPVSTCTIKLYRPRGRGARPHPLPHRELFPGHRRGAGSATRRRLLPWGQSLGRGTSCRSGGRAGGRGLRLPGPHRRGQRAAARMRWRRSTGENGTVRLAPGWG